MSVNTGNPSTPATDKTYIPQEFKLDDAVVTYYQQFGLRLQYGTVTIGDWVKATNSVRFSVVLAFGFGDDNSTTHEGELSMTDYSAALRSLLSHQEMQMPAVTLYDCDPSNNPGAQIVGMLFGPSQTFVPFKAAFALPAVDQPSDTREG
ncbi:MAG TPA: hypothetical protein VLG40_04370 [Candidatus Saccharimonas sp.]|nr:hypothetical protein [Candidatus Saccharimonas sp.]